MPSVRQWLEQQGLGKYARVFEEEEVDFDALPHLTEDMLDLMGLPVGPRARVLAAIAALSGSAVPMEEGAISGRSGPQARAERRQITVMFCDLVDSTRLASRLDPEDLKAIMQAYQQACGAVIERYKGMVAQYLGDGVMTYFGWPAAQEDAAERAVRAGLEVIEAVKAIPGPESLSVRIGIATGIVVISEISSADPSIPSGAIGDTPHIAARLQNLAQPNTVVIADSTSRLVSKRFDLEEMGPQLLKGIVEHVVAFGVRGVQEGASRFDTMGSKTLTPLIGRRTELAFLEQKWRDAEDGEGQAVFVSGVPGIGKSRLIHELKELIDGEEHATLRFQCLPHCTQSAFFPVIRQIERQAKIVQDDSDAQRFDKLRVSLEKITRNPGRFLPCLAEVMSLRAHRVTDQSGSAKQTKAKTIFTLVDLLFEASLRVPVLCIVEDAHWIDPSTQELLDLLIERIGNTKVLVVVTCRPEYAREARDQGNVSALMISRLTRREVTELAQICLRDTLVSAEVMKRIIEDSDAIPLFIEELARGVGERDKVLKAANSSLSIQQSAASIVPDSLRDSLMARLDRVPEARGVAQVAAVIGREFSRDLLSRLASLEPAELDLALAHLEEGEIISRIDNRPIYAFKHALVRDAAYDSLLKSSRREYHANLGEILEDATDVVQGQPELLAYHFGSAGNVPKALEYWTKGAKRARERWANVEAAGQYQTALEYLRQIPKSDERDRTEIELQVALGLSLVPIRVYSSDEPRKAFERACELCKEVPQPNLEVQAIFGLWGYNWMRAQHDEAMRLATLLLEKARPLDSAARIRTEILGNRCLGSTLFTRGEFARADEVLDEAIEAAKKYPSPPKLGEDYAVDPRVAAQLMQSWNLWILGQPDLALTKVLAALTLAIDHGVPYGIVFAQYVTSAVLLLRGESTESLKYAEQSLALSTEHKINLYALYSRFGRGCALADLGRFSEAGEEIRQGIEEAKQSNLGYMRGFMLGWLATVQNATGDPEAAIATIDEALNYTDDVGGRAWEAEVRRLRGEFLLAADPNAPEKAEREIRSAINIAQRQQARSLELRAAMSLANLLHQHRAREGLDVLSIAYGRFSEGFETADLRKARELMAVLSTSVRD